MQGVLTGFAVIAAVIAVGYLVGRRGWLGPDGRQVLSRLAFHVASPALMFTTIGRADLSQLLSLRLVVTAVSTTVVAGIFTAVGAVRGWGAGRTAIGALCACYVNAGNLGIPIAMYVLGDATLAAPVILFQQVVVTPVALSLLDLTNRPKAGTGTPAGAVASPGPGAAARPELVAPPAGSAPHRPAAVLRLLGTPLRNPMAVGSLSGVVVAACGWHLPGLVSAPLRMLGNMSVPAVLLAFGMSLYGSALPGRSADRPLVLFSVVLKSLVQPLLAWTFAAGLLGLHGPALLDVTVSAALPAAQNLFTYAVQYRVGEELARESILLSTLASVPVLFAVAALLG